MKKEAVLKILFECAAAYKENLVGRNLLFICVDPQNRVSTLETVFMATNFLHMTGVKFLTVPKMNARTFYDRCVGKYLRVEDFDLDPLGYTEVKLKVLPRLVTPNLSANMIGDYHSARPILETDKLAGNMHCCMGLVTNFSQAPYYSPNSVLATDIRELASDRVRIIATYRKYAKEKQYSELVYVAKKVDWAKINYPPDFLYLDKPA
ncbi:MAG: PBECR4 domain-containing protein [Lachnospiraceae bacterium]|nr:PBECR4 domain-containing protein [Lachnospiraceae bacterium]